MPAHLALWRRVAFSTIGKHDLIGRKCHTIYSRTNNLKKLGPLSDLLECYTCILIDTHDLTGFVNSVNETGHGVFMSILSGFYVDGCRNQNNDTFQP